MSDQQQQAPWWRRKPDMDWVLRVLLLRALLVGGSGGLGAGLVKCLGIEL